VIFQQNKIKNEFTIIDHSTIFPARFLGMERANEPIVLIGQNYTKFGGRHRSILFAEADKYSNYSSPIICLRIYRNCV